MSESVSKFRKQVDVPTDGILDEAHPHYSGKIQLDCPSLSRLIPEVENEAAFRTSRMLVKRNRNRIRGLGSKRKMSATDLLRQALNCLRRVSQRGDELLKLRVLAEVLEVVVRHQTLGILITSVDSLS